MELNIWQRVVNRFGKRWGVRLYPWADLNPSASDDHREVFDGIHRENYWGSKESLSGGGSTIHRTADYAAELRKLIVDRGFRSIFDAPCGDLNWMPDAIKGLGLDYQGGDISAVALAHAKQRYPEANVGLFDICNDAFPQVDVWHCRDCLFHLSFEDGLKALRNFGRSSIPYALITTNSGIFVRNMDIPTGGHRVTDLQRAPYNLPKPEVMLRDYPVGKEFPRYVALWSREAIAAAVGVLPDPVAMARVSASPQALGS